MFTTKSDTAAAQVRGVHAKGAPQDPSGGDSLSRNDAPTGTRGGRYDPAERWFSLFRSGSGYGTNPGVVKSGYVLRFPFRLRGQVADVWAWVWAWVVKTVRRRGVMIDSPASEHCPTDVFNVEIVQLQWALRVSAVQ